MAKRTATIIGATGLVGSHLLEILEEDAYFSNIRLLVRKPLEYKHPKTEVKLIDFSDAESFKLGIDGSDAVFCAVGTTQKKVKGDKTAYRKVDYEIPVHAARYCKETGCEQFLLVSAVGANKASNNFYLKLKGEAEEGVAGSEVNSISIFRPSVIMGERKEKRTGEAIGKMIMQPLSFLLAGKLSRLKPIHAKDIARAMAEAAKRAIPGVHYYEYNEMKGLLR
ncbi:MAG TPA: NAD(P)H-binding protein [Chitinophagaceae bacterium]